MERERERERERDGIEKKPIHSNKEQIKKKTNRQLVTIDWKIKRWLTRVRNKIEMAIQWTLKTLQCNKINNYIHLIKLIINNQQLNITIQILNLKLIKL